MAFGKGLHVGKPGRSGHSRAGKVPALAECARRVEQSVTAARAGRHCHRPNAKGQDRTFQQGRVSSLTGPCAQESSATQPCFQCACSLHPQVWENHVLQQLPLRGSIPQAWLEKRPSAPCWCLTWWEEWEHASVWLQTSSHLSQTPVYLFASHLRGKRRQFGMKNTRKCSQESATELQGLSTRSDLLCLKRK